jgi:hypothetical protein
MAALSLAALDEIEHLVEESIVDDKLLESLLAL